jgi:predicted acyl esterase
MIPRTGGGIPDPGFQAKPMMKACAGNQAIEDVGSMAREYTTWNEYYDQRKAKLENISVPMYITASWTNFLHTLGTFREFLDTTSSKSKWLRVHNSNEWPGKKPPSPVSASGDRKPSSKLSQTSITPRTWKIPANSATTT